MTVLARAGDAAAAASISASAAIAASPPSDSLHSTVRLHCYQTLTAASHKIFVTQAQLHDNALLANHITTAAQPPQIYCSTTRFKGYQTNSYKICDFYHLFIQYFLVSEAHWYSMMPMVSFRPANVSHAVLKANIESYNFKVQHI